MSQHELRQWRTGPDDTWRHWAACLGASPSLFFPAGERAQEAIDEVREAKAVCASCPVRVPCLEFALRTNEQDGIWGGLTPDERRGLRRHRASSPVRAVIAPVRETVRQPSA